MNILKVAERIVNQPGDKEVAYGDLKDCMDKISKLSSLMSDKEISTVDCYNVLIATKLARQSNSHKEDNLLDAVAYIGSLNDYITKQEQDDKN
jgi:hypothetical protein